MRTTSIRRRVAALPTATAVFLALAGGAAPTAGADSGSHVTCGQVLTEDVVLDADLVDCPGDGLVVGADGIRIELAGHEIDGALTTRSVGIRNEGRDGVRIEDGVVQGFERGLLLAEGADRNLLRKLEVRGNSFHGIEVSASDDTVVERSTISGNEGFGIFLEAAAGSRIARNRTLDNAGGVVLSNSNGNQAERNTTATNLNFGIFLFDSSRNTVERNAVSENGEGGIFLITDDVGSNENLIQRNTVTQNRGELPASGHGIVIDGERNRIKRNFIARNLASGLLARADNRVEGNAIERNGTSGVVIGGSPGTLVVQNTVERNGADGILLSGGDGGGLVARNLARRNADDGVDVDVPGTTIARNTANRNGDLGIEAVVGVVDGGGNRAAGNGNPLQCLNVLCT